MKGFLLFVLLSLISGTVALAEGVDGFELGMPMAKVRQLAIEKSYTFSNPTGSSNGGRWVSYVLFGNSFAGPTLSFCDITLSAVSLQRPSSLHEIASTITEWKSVCGESQAEPKTYYREGTQIARIRFKWLGEDNIQRAITMAQYDQSQTFMIFSCAYIKFPCLP